MRTLHIVDNLDDDLPHRLLAQAREGEATVLLIHDAVLRDCGGGRVYACKADVEARGAATSHQLLDYDGILDLILEHDKVICW